jgi:outer membrane protein assembly factor BamB
MAKPRRIQQSVFPADSPPSTAQVRRTLIIVLGSIFGICFLCGLGLWISLPRWRSPQTLLTFGSRGHDVGQMYTPTYIGVDGQGMIYVGDWDDGRVSVFDPTGKYLRVINLGDGTVLLGMAVAQDGTLYFSYDGAIHRMDPQGHKTTLAYSDAKGDLIADVSGIALEPDGTLAAADNSGDVLHFNSAGDAQLVLAKAFQLPSFSSRNELQPNDAPILSYDVPANSADKNISVATDSSGNIYAVGWISAIVIKMDSNGHSLSKFGGFAHFPGGFERDRFDFPDGIVIGSDGRIYVGDANGVHVFSPDEKFLYTIHVSAGADALTLDPQGNLYIVTYPSQVVKFAPLQP